MNYLKDHWEMLSTFTVMVFGLGGLASRITKIEEIHTDLQEMKEMLARIDERTKHL